MKLYRTSPSRRHGTTSPCEYTVNQLLRPTRVPSRLTWKERGSKCLRNYIQRRLKQAQMNFAKTICDQCIQRPPMVSDNTSSYSSEFNRVRSCSPQQSGFRNNPSKGIRNSGSFRSLSLTDEYVNDSQTITCSSKKDPDARIDQFRKKHMRPMHTTTSDGF